MTIPPISPADDHAIDQAAVLSALRARVARMEGGGATRPEDSIEVCAGMPGMARAALHEVLATEPGCGAAFAAMVLGRTAGTVLWIGSARAEWQAWPPGLAAWGLTPARLVLLRAERWKDALWAMEEALRCPAVGGALLVPAQGEGWAERAPLDLTATRRLQLAAEAGGALGMILQADPSVGLGGNQGGDQRVNQGLNQGGNQGQTAAHTRWRVSPAEGDEPHWWLELLRMRGGRPREAMAVAWQAASGRLEPLEGAMATPRRARR